MLDHIIKFSIKNKIIIGLMTLLLVIWGGWSATRLSIDAVPDITNNQVQIFTSCPTLAGQEVEQLVTFPIEQSIANVPKIEEIRSISRFGLSVVTVVFDEDVDIYFARQLINERLKEAIDKIPQGIGVPEMAPVSTGLGEVYQYIIHPKKGSENKYNAKDLRTMQDWIVARQLYGTPGIAEVNSFGGELKQYEVAVNPDRLRAMGVSIPDIFTALQKNNENTGGAYIDKKPNAYFIRGIGLVTSLEDVKKIVVKNKGGIPIYINDVADVRFGHAVRYGALTYNGEVDAVGGVVMMLKGENSNEVVKRIKEKLPTIQKSLPADVTIEPYLDRTDLVDRAIGTVEKNLIEGALIVIFVLVLFLGNLRAGLIVASAIPLAMLFALGMMNVFGVSANLMSLGAIDFGLIVDGAVIVVEATMHHLGLRKSVDRLSQNEMDNEVFLSASKIRTSAAFGEIIILIVYIPILTLVGVEGKMFRPMAQTVGFAIFGALILSLTYIPMMCALFLSKKVSHKKTFSDKMMDKLQSIYQPLLQKAINIKYTIVGIATALFAVSLFFFSRMGGEFIPQLQEGDYAYHCILPQGSSLSQSIETSMQASRIIKQFDEVEMVVGKTGSAEVPTDPMPPEATDLMVVLKPQKEWKSGRSYNELADAITEKLEIIPGVFFEKNQPIQMRFNELMTGIRQDVAVKIFGENIDTLATYAKAVSEIIQGVPGATSPQIERVSGLPQINIEYDRTRIANYGLTIQDINDVVSTAFAGKSTGQVYENERRFDLVVRLDSMHRSSIDDVSNLMIPTNTGIQIPLSQVANIAYKLGPAQISREAGKRRIVIGFNVSDRDVQSVVEDIQRELAKKVNLPSGYYFTYGGQFENLQKASARLMVAVPASLLLIFMLLYFTFHSFKQATLIFTAIPMSAIGGIFALMLRGMPFSISAGIGFIALFGVAVLNGIVLVGTFNQLKKEGINDILQRVKEGTIARLRPVLMTATVASLGFLPMAISTSAGAEVQKPLATVVIGGLITATFLTLFVLPLLYIIFDSGINLKGKLKMNKTVIIFILCFAGLSSAHAQQRISLNKAIEIALKNNQQLSINEAEIRSADLNTKTSGEIPKTGLFAENEDVRPSDKTGVLKIGITQSIAWPGLYAARKNYLKEQLKYAELNRNVLNASIRKDVRSAYYQLWYLQDKQDLLKRLDSIYTLLFNTAKVRVKTGDVARLDQIAAEAKLKELQAYMEQNEKEMKIQQQQLMMILNRNEWLLPVASPLKRLDVTLAENNAPHPLLVLQEQNVNIASSAIKVQKNTNRPEFSGRFFSQRLWGAADPFTGFSVTASFPLFGTGAYRNRVKVAAAEKEVQEKTLAYQTQLLQTQESSANAEMEKNRSLLNFYETSGLKQAEEIINAASLSYKAGEISFAELGQFLSQAIGIRQNYLDILNQFNQSAINFNYLNNK
ncbi:heavy metal efflux pump, CzcA family [Pseudopedobacter saltans DSM 12145]|uniref:Heavy metal efflux pump, CzcA family n=1 Tax=Pseudopedobacter saltans (strain ATCC 51119 / DSM 12145 / JCM 21818 / CCUG 39354 / LMG 10337 / NBRC 100064 / NCIMB 13643) TaxID=762903 RepID=F0SCU3_PSESL|nr:CusA/CzcA family heavy metal efflux RND transporter [Pseudopedobacter saltans]ADY50682.1 heavy metal efflux pump, CzcA family [Pseudopedobacter saltans DSM 12145]